jgi:hypothetical protein
MSNLVKIDFHGDEIIVFKLEQVKPELAPKADSDRRFSTSDNHRSLSSTSIEDFAQLLATAARKEKERFRARSSSKKERAPQDILV